jgi:pimeloyl-ACP methyl ester carboxylesterase
MTDKKLDQQIKLQDGRMLGYAEYGAPEGKPVFYLHGFPSSRYDWPLFDPNDIATDLNARVIAVDRPGTGLSDSKRGRVLLDWPDDLMELANALELDRFAVLGISGGGPFALACAFKIPERLTVAGIVCGMGPAEAPGMKESGSWTLPGKFSLFRRFSVFLMFIGLRKDPDKVLARSKEMFSEPDRNLLDQPEVARVFIESMQEALRPGTGGANQDAAIYARPWGFRLQDITTDVRLWHGEPDITVLVSVGRYHADAIPNCHAVFFDNEGHFTLLYNRIREILGALVT